MLKKIEMQYIAIVEVDPVFVGQVTLIFIILLGALIIHMKLI